MAMRPSVNNDDIDRFEDLLGEFIREATPGALQGAVVYACRVIELNAEHKRYNLNTVNNATSMICTVTRRLMGKLEQAREAVQTHE